MKGNIFRSHRHANPDTGSAITISGGLPLIEANLFYNHFCDERTAEQPGAVVLATAGTAPRLTNNIFADNGCVAVAIHTEDGSARLINNTLVRNHTGFLIRGSRAIVRNNLLTDNKTGLLVSGDREGIHIDHNMFQNKVDVLGTSPDPIAQDGNMVGEPDFWIPEGRTFELRFSSAAIDAGSMTEAPLFDFRGTPRPMARGVDIGAMEAPVNLPPTGRKIDDLMVSQGSGAISVPLQPVFHDPDGPFEELRLSVAGVSIPLFVDFSISESRLVLVPATGRTGSSDITLSAIDPGGLEVRVTFTVTIVPVLEADVPNRFPTIQAAIDNAEPGATIIVAPGTYNFPINFGRRELVVESQGGPQVTILDGEGLQSPLVRIGPGGVIKGFTIRNVKSTGLRNAAVRVIGNGSVIQGNIFENNSNDRSASALAVFAENASPIVHGNIFRDNPGDIAGGRLPGVILISGEGSAPLLSNNLFLRHDRSWCVVVRFGADQARIVNNTFVDNAGSGEIYKVSRPPVVQNNLSVDRLGFRLASGVFENNLVKSTSGRNYIGISDPTGTDGNISEDPIFVDPSSGNYRLQPHSPGVDRGRAVDVEGLSAITGYDLDGTSRPQGTAYDIGAFELVDVVAPRSRRTRIHNVSRTANGEVTIEFYSIAGRRYQVDYGSTLADWVRSPTSVLATGEQSEWIDHGAPHTNEHPAKARRRYYRIIESE